MGILYILNCSASWSGKLRASFVVMFGLSLILLSYTGEIKTSCHLLCSFLIDILIKLLVLIFLHSFLDLVSAQAPCDCETECPCSQSNCTAGQYWLSDVGCVECPAGHL